MASGLLRGMSFVLRTRSRIRPWVTLYAPFALALFAACTPLKRGDVRPDAGSAPAGKSNCEHAEPPGPPSGVASSTVEKELIFAASSSDVGDSDNGPNGAPRYQLMGYDLDHTCTGQGQGSSCVKPPWETLAIPTDQPAGRDSSANVAFYQASLILPPEQRAFADFKPDLDSGKQTVLLRIRGYNGEADDDRIEVAIFSGTLWENALSGGPGPKWDGHDQWRITTPWLERAADGSLNSELPRFHDAAAYVTDYTIVAHLDSTLFGLAFIPAGTWHQVILKARIVAVGDGFELQDGIIAGRWPVRDMLNFVRLDLPPGNATPTCREGIVFSAFVNQLCPFVDIASTNDKASAECDAISIVIAFTAAQAEMGEPIDLPAMDPVHCDPPATDCNGKPLY